MHCLVPSTAIHPLHMAPSPWSALLLCLAPRSSDRGAAARPRCSAPARPHFPEGDHLLGFPQLWGRWGLEGPQPGEGLGRPRSPETGRAPGVWLREGHRFSLCLKSGLASHSAQASPCSHSPGRHSAGGLVAVRSGTLSPREAGVSARAAGEAHSGQTGMLWLQLAPQLPQRPQ